MATITFVTTCMGRLESLKQTLPAAIEQMEAAVVVVDYSCPQHCAQWVESAFPTASVVRVHGQHRFNLARARNAGAAACQTPWLGFVDADVLLAPRFAETVLPMLRPGMFYQAAPMPRDWHLLGTVLCSLDDFNGAGRYDEVMQGWGCEDRDLYLRFHLHGVRAGFFPASLVRHLDHEDALRVRHYELKDKRHSQTINRFYMAAKADLTRAGGRPLSVEHRARLYDEVAGALTQESVVHGVAATNTEASASMWKGKPYADAMSRAQQPRRLTLEHEAAHAIAALAGGGTISHIDLTVHDGITSVSMGSTSWQPGPDTQNTLQAGWTAGPAQHAIACGRLGESAAYADAAAEEEAGQMRDFLSERGSSATKSACRGLIDAHMPAVTKWLLHPEVQPVVQALADELTKRSGVIEWSTIPEKIRTARLPPLPRVVAVQNRSGEPG